MPQYEEEEMRLPRAFVGLLILFGIGAWILVPRLREGSHNGGGRDETAVEYGTVIVLPRRPPFCKDLTEYVRWLDWVLREFEKGKALLSNGDLPAAKQVFQTVQTAGARARQKLSGYPEWRYRSVGPEAGALRKLAEIAEREGQHDKAEQMREEATRLEESAKRFDEVLGEFKADVSWGALRRKWFNHNDATLRLLAIHVAAIGAANRQPGYDKEAVLSQLRKMAKDDPDHERKKWISSYMEWLESLGN